MSSDPPEPAETTTNPTLVNATTPVSLTKLYLPLYIATGICGIVCVFGPVIIRKGPHQGLIRWCIVLTAFWAWLFWSIIYAAQMNPLVGPRLDNATLAWVGHYWGIDPKTL